MNTVCRSFTNCKHFQPYSQHNFNSFLVLCNNLPQTAFSHTCAILQLAQQGSHTLHSPGGSTKKESVANLLAQFIYLCWLSARRYLQLLDISQRTISFLRDCWQFQKQPAVTPLMGFLNMAAYAIKPEKKISRPSLLTRQSLVTGVASHHFCHITVNMKPIAIYYW